MEYVLNSNGVPINGEHAVSIPSVDRPSNGQHTAGQYKADRVQLAVVENEFASVTISLDTAGHSPRLHVRDNETGEDIVLSAIELASLCLATGEDRAGWLKVGLYRTDGEPGAHRTEAATPAGEAGEEAG